MKKFKFELVTKLQDGTPIVFDGDFVVGTLAFSVKEDGTKEALVDGDYTLEDGTVFTVATGAISVINEVAEPAVESVEQAEVTAPEAQDEAQDAVDYQTQIDELKIAVEELKNAIAQNAELMSSMNAQTEEKFASVKLSSDTKLEEKPIIKTQAQKLLDKIQLLRG